VTRFSSPVDNDLVRLLRSSGPSLTIALIAEMVKAGISPAAARQRIARAGDSVTRLAGLRFAHNARFFFLSEQFGRPSFWKAIENACKSHGQSYWGAIIGLKARGGAFPLKLFPGLCGAPLARKGQLSPERIIERLQAIHMVEQITDEATGERFIAFQPLQYRTAKLSHIRAQLAAEDVVLHGMKEWCRRLGLASFERVRLRGDEEPPVVSSITWDFSGPSYARPLAQPLKGTLRPGFIVADVNLGKILDADEVAHFVRKHDLAAGPLNVAPIMPFLVADGFTATGFSLARQKGILATTTAQMFGEEVAKALRDLINLLSNAGATAAMNPEHLERVMGSLTKIEGAAHNLRGHLFELAVGALVKDVEGGYLRAGDEVRDALTRRSAEIDVLLDMPDDKGVLIIECKSKSPTSCIGLPEIQKWREDRVPLLRDILRSRSAYAAKKLTFELWTNAPIAGAELEWLESHRAEEGCEIGWRDGEAMKTYLEKSTSKSLNKIMNEHYFRHALVRVTPS
jgi:hypothetical protein